VIVRKAHIVERHRASRSDEKSTAQSGAAAAATKAGTAGRRGVDDAEVVDLDVAGIDEQTRQTMGVERRAVALDGDRSPAARLKAGNCKKSALTSLI